MDVLGGRVDDEAALLRPDGEGRKATPELGGDLGGQDARLPQHRRVGYRALEVLGQEALVDQGRERNASIAGSSPVPEPAAEVSHSFAILYS